MRSSFSCRVINALNKGKTILIIIAGIISNKIISMILNSNRGSIDRFIVTIFITSTISMNMLCRADECTDALTLGSGKELIKP